MATLEDILGKKDEQQDNNTPAAYQYMQEQKPQDTASYQMGRIEGNDTNPYGSASTQTAFQQNKTAVQPSETKKETEEERLTKYFSTLDRDDPNAYVKAFMAYHPHKPMTAEEKAEFEKKQKRKAALAGLNDSIAALANLYSTTQYAPDHFDPTRTMSERQRVNYDRLKKDMEVKDRDYFNGLWNAVGLDIKAAAERAKAKQQQENWQAEQNAKAAERAQKQENFETQENRKAKEHEDNKALKEKQIAAIKAKGKGGSGSGSGSGSDGGKKDDKTITVQSANNTGSLTYKGSDIDSMATIVRKWYRNIDQQIKNGKKIHDSDKRLYDRLTPYITETKETGVTTTETRTYGGHRSNANDQGVVEVMIGFLNKSEAERMFGGFVNSEQMDSPMSRKKIRNNENVIKY